MLVVLARVLLLCVLGLPLAAKDAYLFTSFRSNGETGLFLVGSPDGKTWTALNGDKPWLKPTIPGMLMRDPWLGRGPDGVWHLLWTTGWKRDERGLAIGHSSSRDLLTWTPQTLIPVMEQEAGARNAWAPEAVWNAAGHHWIVFWASTVPDRFPQAGATGDDGYDHRIYAMTTSDWKTFTPSRLWFNPGFNCIDSTVVEDGPRWWMIFKDERRTPLRKQLRLASAASAAGPWTNVTEPFTESWVEGPTALKIGAEWWIYFDHYTAPQHYGAVRTRDWKTFTDVTGEVHFPPGQRHGTAVRISDHLLRTLTAQQR